MRNCIFILFEDGSLCGVSYARSPPPPTAEPPNFLHAKCFSRWHNVRREPNGRFAPESGKFILCTDRSSHAQAPSVPIRRAGRRARERDQVLFYVLRGEKSVIGGTCNFSVAPHLHRKFVREVRLEFSWTVARASGRSTCKVVCFFSNFSFKQRKVYKPPTGEKDFVRRREFVRIL